MKQKLLLNLFCLFVLNLGAQSMYAQTKLYIEQKENPKFSIPLSEIRRLTFSDTDLVLHPKGEDVQSFSLIDLTRLHFKDVLASLSTSPYTTQEINVYPNPASQIVNVEYELSIPQNVNIQICNMQGHVMQKHHFKGASGFNSQSINLEGLISGVYILHWQAGQQVESTKLLIQ